MQRTSIPFNCSTWPGRSWATWPCRHRSGWPICPPW